MIEYSTLFYIILSHFVYLKNNKNKIYFRSIIIWMK